MIVEPDKPTDADLSKPSVDRRPTAPDTPNVSSTPPVSDRPPSRRIQKWQLAAAVTAVAAAIIGGILTVTLQRQRHAEDLARTQANVSIQAGVQPSIWETVDGQRTPRTWFAWMFIMNYGPAAADQLIVHVHLANPERMSHSLPRITSSPAAAEVKVLQRRPLGYYQLVVSNLQPGEGFRLEIDFVPSPTEVSVVRQVWPRQMFERAFTRHFISSIDAMGERVNASLDGIYKFGGSKE
jgi:hypothetical protein